ncbi:invasion associated locus B family protein [Pseudomonas putida]|uniref:invasion associated locus B family protein n=1 Tax=Pseudomonas putida TaxID=303 RepID=UPI003D95B7E8
MSKSQSNTLLGEAAQLREVHDNWILAFATQTVDGVVGQRGVLIQEQTHQPSNQRVLSIELWPEAAQFKGALMLPFGLALQEGVTLCVDEGVPFTLPFRTCLAGGCVVDVEFDEGVSAQLRVGDTLMVTVVTADIGKEVAFAIPLKGLCSAHDRLLGLLQ